MSLLSIAPDAVSAASGNLENLGSTLRSVTTAAAGQTPAIAAPAADEVSAAVTALFGAHGQQFQALSAKASAFHDEFVNLLNGGAAQYVSAEVANARQTLVNAVNAPAEALLGHPLIGAGQASAGAAAASATSAQAFTQNFGPFQFSFSASPAGVFQSVTLNTPFGPVGSLSLSGVPFFPASGGVGLTLNGTGTANTPLGGWCRTGFVG